MRPLDEIARFLGGRDDDGRPRPVTIVDAGTTKELDIQVIVPVEDMGALGEVIEGPSDLPADMEKITDKARVVAELKKSIEHLRATAKTMNEAELEKSVKLFGNNTTQRGVYGTILNHLHEHLGQSIAYARINGVAPPWSAGMN